MNENGNGVPVVAAQMQIVITLDVSSGAMQVKGPVENKVVFLGMLEYAKQACLGSVQTQKEPSRIALVPPGTTIRPMKQ
jgi:hypothetical protein